MERVQKEPIKGKIKQFLFQVFRSFHALSKCYINGSSRSMLKYHFSEITTYLASQSPRSQRSEGICHSVNKEDLSLKMKIWPNVARWPNSCFYSSHNYCHRQQSANDLIQFKIPPSFRVKCEYLIATLLINNIIYVNINLC